VIVTGWATSDQQEGELFRSFYNRRSSVSHTRGTRTRFSAQVLIDTALPDFRGLRTKAGIGDPFYNRLAFGFVGTGALESQYE
jgi:hypothetical protein